MVDDKGLLMEKLRGMSRLRRFEEQVIQLLDRAEACAPLLLEIGNDVFGPELDAVHDPGVR